MTNFHESYLARHGFDITTPGLKTDYRSAALPTALLGLLNMHACMHICAMPERACVYAGDGRTGWTEAGEMVDLHVYMRVCTCALPCLRACDPVCENGMIDARSDG